MEADFQRFYQMDLNQAVFREDMSFRRFKVLSGNLPADSAFAEFLRNNKNRIAASDHKEIEDFAKLKTDIK